MSVAHAFVSVVPDGADASVVRPSNWNAAHVVSLTAADVGADPAGSAATAQSAAIAAAASDATTKANTAQSTAEAYADGLAPNYAAAGVLNTATVRHAAGVPSGAPTGTELPIAFDSTATTGGIYLWTGAAWVLAGPIPPVITPG